MVATINNTISLAWAITGNASYDKHTPMLGDGPVHGSASGALIIWWPFELVFGDCHGSATSGCALLSQGSIGCGGDLDSHGSTDAGMFRMVLPLVPIGTDPLL